MRVESQGMIQIFTAYSNITYITYFTYINEFEKYPPWKIQQLVV